MPYSPGFAPTDLVSIPSPRGTQQRLPSIKDLHLPTPPASGEFPKVDDFAADDDRYGQRTRSHQCGTSHYFDQPLFGAAHDSRQSSLSPRTSAVTGFSSARNGQRYGPVYDSAPASHLASSFLDREQVIWRHRVDSASEFNRRQLSQPSNQDYGLVCDFWQASRKGFRSYAPWTQPEPSKQDADALRVVASNQQASRPTGAYAQDTKASLPASADRDSISDSSPVRDGPSSSSMPKTRSEQDEEKANVSRSRRRASPHSARTLVAKRPRYVNSPEPMDGSDSYSTSLPGPRRKRPRMSSQSISSLSVREAKHSRNRSTKEKKSSDIRDYPDYSPPFETMRNPVQHAREVKAQSVKNPIDLSADPLRHELHEAERIVAQALNISCDGYLLVKRQLFCTYLNWLKEKRSGRQKGNWNKTAAQRESNIDVGKTSQVFVFYQSIGWFDAEHFERFL